MLKETLLKFLKLDSLVDNVTGYVEARIELMKIELREEVAKGLAKTVVLLVILALFTLFVWMTSMAAAYKIGESLGIYEGFAIVGCFYLVVGLVFYLFRNPITEKLEKRLEAKKNKKKT
ncbi:MAG: phage holin family protein [Cyclobacteriaceae bacterium]|jgi:uncharacterized membrane protein YqjE|nr:phage holin family protein [Cyclobacteriaceae bacterium]MDH4294961.1 phage holin family protein [Cyclobacteriaceae bacterium]MDH5250044.1 phage holin family protein [Cyclobacteriaceae bacterium]